MLVKVEAYHDGRFWCARGIRADLFTQGKTLDQLLKNLREAASLHFEDTPAADKNLTLRLVAKIEIRREGAPVGVSNG